MQLVVLPGMDGGSHLSRECRSQLAKDYPVRAIEYPDETLPTDELADLVLERIGDLSDVVLIGESFSGPVAIEAIRRDSGRFAGLVLAFSFVRPPVSPGWRPFVHSALFRRPPPAWAVRRWMAGPDASEDSVREIRAAIGQAGPAVIAGRVRTRLEVDACASLGDVSVPVLSLRAQRDRLVDARSAPEAHVEVDAVTIDAPHLGLHARPVASARAIRTWTEAL